MNFISIAFDDLNAFAFLKELYGGALVTPNIDRVMAMGTTFDNAFSQVAICNASRTSVLTGQAPGLTGVHANYETWHEYVDASATLPAMLKTGGYYTSIIGKVFHELAVAPEVAGVVADYAFGNGAHRFFDNGLFGTHPLETAPETHGDYINVDKAIELLDAAGADPFAMFLGLAKPHLSWVVPQQYFDLYPLDQIVLPFQLDGDLSDVPEFIKGIIHEAEHAEVLAADYWKAALQGYFASISFADAMLGRVLDTLEANGQLDTTAILLWTDHGYHLGDKDTWHKFTLWEEAARAPFVLALPGAADDGQHVEQVVELVDIVPTVLDLLGLDVPDGLSGRSLLPFVANPALIDDAVAVTTMYGSAALRTNSYRYIRYEDGSTELYDIAADPNQWTNLAGDPTLQAVRDGLDARLRAELSADGWVLVDPGQGHVGTDADQLFVLAPGHGEVAGGGGDDSYFVSSAVSPIVELEGGGHDTVYVSTDYVMPDHIEELQIKANYGRLVLTGNVSDNIMVGGGRIYGMGGADDIRGTGGKDTLDGGAGDDRLEGYGGDDVLAGGDGSDHLDGASGHDIASYAGAAAAVTVALGPVGAQDTSGAGIDTLAFIEGLAGSGWDDVLTGNGVANSIDGGAGSDLIEGGGGDDRLGGGSGVDTVSYGSAGAAVEVSLAVAAAQATGGAGTDTLASFENILGSAYDDKLTGNDGTNLIAGGGGNDSLDGGLGFDTVSYLSAGAGVSVNLAVAGPQDTGGAGIDTLTGFERIAGSAWNDRLIGDGGSNRIDAGAGDDEVDGGAGTDELAGGDGIDRLSYASAASGVRVSLAIAERQNTLGGGFDTLSGFETLVGSAWADQLTGSGQANILDGGEGEDVLAGGAGDDLYILDQAGDVVTEAADEGADEVRTGLSAYTLAANVETLTGTAAAGQALTGNALANRIAGGAGDDRIEGGVGDDSIDGGGGSDTASFASAARWIRVDLYAAAPQDTLGAGLDTIVGIENVTGSSHGDRISGERGANVLDGAGGNDRLFGMAGDDVLIGGEGADLMSGLGGLDHMTGGAGDDVYYVEQAGDVTVEAADQGHDIVRAFIDHQLADNIEELRLAGAARTGTGNGLANLLYGTVGGDVLTGLGAADRLEGGDGDDRLDGGADDDVMLGGAGNDVYSVDEAGDVVTEAAEQGIDEVRTSLAAYTLGAELEGLTGTAAAGQALTGNALANVIAGGVGDDSIDGGAGDDRLDGGLGSDTVSYASASAGVRISFFLAGPQDTGGAGIDTLAGFEHALGSSFDDVLGGSAAANRLEGGAGGDRLNGMGGNDLLIGGDGGDVLTGNGGDDRMEGGAGADVYYVEQAGDTVVEDADQGRDVVRAYVDHALADHVEELRLAGAARAGTGNGGANRIVGTAFGDMLSGLGGDDLLEGGNGADTLSGGADKDRLLGGAGNDILAGDDSDDQLWGQQGIDTMTGGAGADIFAFDDDQTGASEAAADIVTDFAAGDRLHLRAIDADAAAAGDQAFRFLGSAAFTGGGAGGELRYELAGAHTFIQGDLDGDGIADLFIRVDGRLDMAAADFVL
jgi:Ca2+-binding RTX toxin-like protein/arylsulfatase A-like enzyme